MKKFVLLIGIIAACMMSLNSFSQIQVTANCSGSYVITDPNYNSSTDSYEVILEVTSLYPSTGFSSYWSEPSPNPYNFSNLLVYPVEYLSPVNLNYYNMIIIVYKYRSGTLYATRSGSSYGGFTFLSGTYYLTAYNTINVASF
jgi:hypothetical protein